MLHSLSKDTAFTGETAPRHTFLCSDSQCLPPGDPRILCAIHGYPITGKSFIQSVIILVIKQIITRMITDRIGLHSVLLPQLPLHINIKSTPPENVSLTF